MLNRIINFGCIFDWFSPVSSLLSDDTKFNIPESIQPNLMQKLKSSNIKITHSFFHGETFCFDVQEKDRKAVEEILGYELL